MTKVLQYDDNGGMQETDISTGGLTNFTESTYTYSSKTGVKLTPNSTETNVDVVLQPKGTGAILAQQPDGTTTGGHNRGTNSVDLQMNRNSASGVVSGNYSCCPGGWGNIVSNSYTFAAGGSAIASGTFSSGIGSVLTASASYSSVFGYNAISNKYGQYSRASGRISANGDSQTSELLMRKQTTNATETEIFLDGSSARLTLINNSILSCYVMIVGKTAAAVTGYSYHRKVVIAKGGTSATTVLLQNETIGTDYEADVAATIAITADTTNGALKITVTGIASTTINWLCLVKNIEVVKS